MDSRGFLRGRCSVKDCSCDGFQAKERSSSCANCDHKPVKHRLVPKETQTRDSPTSTALISSRRLFTTATTSESETPSSSLPFLVKSSAKPCQSSEVLIIEDCESSDDWESLEDTSHSPAIYQPLSLTPGYGPSTFYPSGQVCSLEGCQNLRYTDEKGFTHDCCSFSHAMEYQRRKAISQAPTIKGITHCLLPYCNALVWPFENYCGRTHANIGISKGLQPPLPAGDIVSQSSGVSTLMAAKDDSMCSLPQCRRPRYIDTDGTVHPFCGHTHADLAKVMNIQVALPEGEKCIIPECHRRRYKDGAITHPYCSRSHAEEGKRRGIFATAEQEEDQCNFEGCTRPKYVEGSIKYDYCSKEHAVSDMSEEKILKSKSDVMTWLGKFGNIKVINLSENDAAKNGGQLFKRFQAAYKGLPQDQRRTILAFHGTLEANISSICSNGFDPSRRKGQAYGPGEYFATTPDISINYSSGNKMLVCELLLGQDNHTQHSNIVVMKNPDHDLPRFVLQFR